MSRYQCHECGCYVHATNMEAAAKAMRPQCATYSAHTPRPLIDDTNGPKQAQLQVLE